MAIIYTEAHTTISTLKKKPIDVNTEVHMKNDSELAAAWVNYLLV